MFPNYAGVAVNWVKKTIIPLGMSAQQKISHKENITNIAGGDETL